MQTTISTKGNVQLPDAIRRELGLKAGDALEVKIKNGDIVLHKSQPKRKKSQKACIITSPVTGLPVLTAGEGAPVLTSEMVREMLADFP